MELHFPQELKTRLDRIAAENNRGPEEYVQQLVEFYLDHDIFFRQKAMKSLDYLDRGEFLTHEEVGSRIEKLFHS